MASPYRTLLGFDFGMRRIGVAVGQTITGSARALQVVACRDGKPDWESISRLIRDWQPDALVIGLPLNMDDTPQAMTDAARRFGRQLQGRYNLPVLEADERLSSYEAEQRMADSNQSQPLDAVAAQVILETWMHTEHP